MSVPPQQKDPNITQGDPSQLAVDSTMLDPNRRYPKLAKKELKNGKWVKAKEVPIEEEIQKLKNDILQGDEVIKKLKTQKEKLEIEVKFITDAVSGKVMDSKKEEKERIKKTIQSCKDSTKRKIDIFMPQLTQEEISIRVSELNREKDTSIKQSNLLKKELEKLEQENNNEKVTDTISNLEKQIKESDNKISELSSEIKNKERMKKEKEKKIESIQGDRDDAQKINSLTQDLFSITEKIKNLEYKKENDQRNYEIKEKLIVDMLAKYQENINQLNQQLTSKGEPELKVFKPDTLYQDPEYEKKRKEREKEKDKEQSKPVEDEEVEMKKVPPYQKKLVKEMRKDQDNYDELPLTFDNYLYLDQTLRKLLKYKQEQDKMWNKEFKTIEEKLNNIHFDTTTVIQFTREKEKEKQLADQKFVEIKKLVKNTELPPLESETQKLSLLEKKKLELEKKRVEIERKQKTIPKLPFSERKFKFMTKSSHKHLGSSIEEREQTQLEQLLDVNFRLSNRFLFGQDPDKDTIICDDVNVVGMISIQHRIRKILFYHNIENGLIYGFQSEYIRDDKKSTVAGQWQINDYMKKAKDTKLGILDIESDDWINQLTIEVKDSFINYLKFETKRGKILEVGKSQGKDIDQKSIYVYKRQKGEVPVTIFGGFNALEQPQDDNENPLALSCFGLESAQKMKAEEKNILEAERQKRKEQKEREEKERLLKESQASLLEKIGITSDQNFDKLKQDNKGR